MKRIKISPRHNYQKKLEDLSFNFHSLNNVYWDESAYYGGHISNRTSVVYRTRSGSYAATSGGRVAHVSVPHGSVGHSSHTSRGGFGHSASSHSGHSSGS